MPRRSQKIDLRPLPDDPAVIAREIRQHLRAATREIDALVAELASERLPTERPQTDLFGRAA